MPVTERLTPQAVRGANTRAEKGPSRKPTERVGFFQYI